MRILNFHKAQYRYWLTAGVILLVFACVVTYKWPSVKGQFRKFELYRNQRHSYDFPPENNGWKKFGTSPVYGDGENTMFDPYCYIEGDSLKMLVSDRAKGTLATVSSTDGTQWGNYTTLLSGINGTWENIVNRGCIVRHNETYYLWYTGQHGGKSYIGLATSRNGMDYRRESTNPILKPEMEQEGVSVMNPCVIWDEESGCFKMWYSAGETYEPNVICYAESLDGIKWDKRNEPVLQKGDNEWEKERVGGCQVIKENNLYRIYYIGYQNIDVARICYAESLDGIEWKRPSNNLLLSPTQDGWDALAVYKPTVVMWNGNMRLYYNGRNNNGEYIGLAIKSPTVK